MALAPLLALRPLLPQAAAILLFCLALAAPLRAQDVTAFARWGSSSGALPPDHAWDYTVTFITDRRVTVEYCKGYAQEAPGCATVSRRLSQADYAALQEKLVPLLAGLAEAPPQPDPNPPVGGGSSWGSVAVAGKDIALPGFPVDQDHVRVRAILTLLADYTPKGAIDAAQRRAKAG